jgi:anti-sigma regulatory factor (Ser/Thr protein kinase)
MLYNRFLNQHYLALSMPSQEFQFNAGEHRFVPLLQQMLQYIGQHVVMPATGVEKLLFEAKIILTELLTNGIKHSGGHVILLRIEIENHAITLIKKDAGPSMMLLQHPQLCQPGDTICITHDVMHALHATLTSSKILTFTCTEHDLPGPPDPVQLAEHFGLLIIAKAADEFWYECRDEKNVFVVKIALVE